MTEIDKDQEISIGYVSFYTNFCILTFFLAILIDFYILYQNITLILFIITIIIYQIHMVIDFFGLFRIIINKKT